MSKEYLRINWQYCLYKKATVVGLILLDLHPIGYNENIHSNFFFKNTINFILILIAEIDDSNSLRDCYFSKLSLNSFSRLEKMRQEDFIKN